MSHSLSNHDDNHFHETQHKEASNSDERKKESITLKLLKTIFESTLRQMELAVINKLSSNVYLFNDIVINLHTII